MSAPQRAKRGPTVLVTDARDNVKRAPQRPTAQSRASSRIISVDNVLQYASEIPSGQRRVTPAKRVASSGRYPNESLLHTKGPVAKTAGHIPGRSSKTSEKLVLLPEAPGSPPDSTSPPEDEEDEDAAPPSDAELARRQGGSGRDKSYAERLPKARRADKLARVTAYCTSQSSRLRATADFVREQHGARTKLYDNCLYCVYQLPLLGGSGGYRVRSSPVRKNPGGKSVLDEQIEANERRVYREGWQEDQFEYSVRGHDGQNQDQVESETQQSENFTEQGPTEHQVDNEPAAPAQHGPNDESGRPEDGDQSERRESNASSSDASIAQAHAAAMTIAELYIFSYGVAVFWNFGEFQEKDILADLTFSSTIHLPSTSARFGASSATSPTSPTALKGRQPPSSALSAALGTTLLVRPLPEADFETEEFHFEYNRNVDKPRIYNDMITLRTTDHMIKLAMSHAIAQSTKLSFFEERMQRTMSKAQYVPRRLALEGTLGMNRSEVVTLVGKLFEGRVNVNLSSNMLDTPSFFWDSEPTLHPLYQAVREYLEIKPRVQLMNERCKVFLDLAEILSDSIADTKMTRITWIIIVLIMVSILVTLVEVFLRFGLVSTGGGGGGGARSGSPNLGADDGVGITPWPGSMSDIGPHVTNHHLLPSGVAGSEVGYGYGLGMIPLGGAAYRDL